jgi:hypothetical protein
MKLSHPNVSVQIFDGQPFASIECVGRDRCKNARFFTDPPEADDECAHNRSMACTHPVQCRAALKAIAAYVNDELKQFEV